MTDVAERRREALKGAREMKTARARDRSDRDEMEARLKALGAEHGECDPDDVDVIFVGDLSDALVFIPERRGMKRAHRLSESV